MFKTPITKKALDDVRQCKNDALKAKQRAADVGKVVVRNRNHFLSPTRLSPSLLIVGSYAMVALLGARLIRRRKVVIEAAPAKARSTALIKLLGKAVALLTVRQKIKKMSLEQSGEVSDTPQSTNQVKHS